MEYYEYVFVALVIQHRVRMRSIVMCGLPVVPRASTLSHKRSEFRKKFLNIKCVF